MAMRGAAGHGSRLGSLDRRRAGGVLIGVGLAGTLDEVVLHQVLQWHSFYDRGSRHAGIVSDGVFHLVSTAVLALGLVIALSATGGAVLRAREGSGLPGGASGGAGPIGPGLLGAVLVGLGGFNLFDATVNHKLLRIHQVRGETDNLLPYDLAFGGLALAVLLVGVALLRKTSTEVASRRLEAAGARGDRRP